MNVALEISDFSIRVFLNIACWIATYTWKLVCAKLASYVACIVALKQKFGMPKLRTAGMDSSPWQLINGSCIQVHSCIFMIPYIKG